MKRTWEAEAFMSASETVIDVRHGVAGFFVARPPGMLGNIKIRFSIVLETIESPFLDAGADI